MQIAVDKQESSAEPKGAEEKLHYLNGTVSGQRKNWLVCEINMIACDQEVVKNMKILNVHLKEAYWGLRKKIINLNFLPSVQHLSAWDPQVQDQL